ncbi:acyl-CoA dehydrogenase family protein [Sinomonas sp. G460-2]|uniref:acyl-CoA dehydrogenase family protein n=1 Tax=Sinomonas sp. G460-2 TaxID=3393464 RepID=UPI0039EF8433
MVAEELAAGDLSVAYLFKHNWCFSQLVRRLPERLRGETVWRVCSEPEYLLATAVTEVGSGSDNHVPSDDPALGLQFRAEPDGDGWILNGTKMMITNARMAGMYFVSARTDPTVPASAGATMFAVPAETEGIAFGEPDDKLGQRTSIQCDVHFTDCRIPGDLAVSGVRGGHGDGPSGANIASNLVKAAMSVGVARSAFQEALQWSTERVQGGSLIYTHQVVSRDLGRMRSDIEAAQSYVLRVARLYDAVGQDMDHAMAYGANVFAREMVLHVARLGMEMFGGRGMMGEWPAEKIMRDALTLQHGFGTNPLMLITIGTAAAEEALRTR